MIVPHYLDKFARFGALGGVYYVDLPAKPRNDVAWARDKIALPYSPEYATYIMLLRNREEKTGIRYFEVDAQRVHDSEEIIHVPDLKGLPLAETRPDGLNC